MKSREPVMLGSLLLLMTATAICLLPLLTDWPCETPGSWTSESAGCLNWAAPAKLLRRPNDDNEAEAATATAMACLSRTAHSRYLPPLSTPPSDSLTAALAAYERLHADCLTTDGPLAFNSNFTLSSASCKYLLYIEGPAGLGNRIMALVSAFLYALLTQRVLLLDGRGHLAKLLCQPFSHSSWLAPQGFPYQRVLAAAAAPGGSQLDILVHVQLQHDQSSQDQLFWSATVQEQLQAVPWIAWSSNQYLVPRFFAMPSFWPRLLALFPSHASLAFTQLARRILLPENEAWERALNAYGAYLSASDTTVGVQVRQHFVKQGRVFNRAAHDRIMECLTTHMKVVPAASTRKLIMAPCEHLLKPGKRRKIALMLASLQEGYYEEMKEAFLRPHYNSPAVAVGVHTLSQQKQEEHSWEQALMAFVEMWVLAMCEELATSSWSTFGYVARGLRGRPSWLLHLRGDHMNPLLHNYNASYGLLGACSLEPSPDPCNHFPFLAFHNHSYPVINHHSSHMDDWVKDHLKSCIDEPRGIQLVD